MRRGFWFIAGAGAGVYVVVKARRAAEALTPDGMRDRLSGLAVGAQLFTEEVRSGMAERESELRERFALLEEHRALEGPGEGPRRLTSAETFDHDGLAAAPPALEGTH